VRSRYVTRQIWVRGARALVFTRTSTLLHGQRNANGTLVSTLEPRRRSPIPRMVLISFLIRPADSSLTTGVFFRIRRRGRRLLSRSSYIGCSHRPSDAATTNYARLSACSKTWVPSTPTPCYSLLQPWIPPSALVPKQGVKPGSMLLRYPLSFGGGGSSEPRVPPGELSPYPPNSSLNQLPTRLSSRLPNSPPAQLIVRPRLILASLQLLLRESRRFRMTKWLRPKQG
jgi:hypothetical protein